MAYHDLSSCTLTSDERWAEANRIFEMLMDVDEESFTKREHDFLTEVGMAIPISVKQLFWLRDIKDKYL